MNYASLEELLDTFVDFLSTEKGYSVNTCRAYQHDLEDFIAFFFTNRALALTYSEEDGDGEEIDVQDVTAISGLMIRSYLGFLHKQKIKKSSVARPNNCSAKTSTASCLETASASNSPT